MKRRIQQYILAAICIVIFIVMSFSFEKLSFVKNEYTAAIIVLLRNVIQILILMGWTYSLKYRIINKKLSFIITLIAYSMVTWLLLRTIKYVFLPSDTLLHRHVWYAYYVPIAWIPTFAVLSLDYLWQIEEIPFKTNKIWLCLIALIFSVLALTNDIHNLFFSFPSGIELYDTIYKHEIGYYAICVWAIILVLYFFVMCGALSVHKRNNIVKLIPFAAIIVVAILTVLYINGFLRGDFIMFDCAVLMVVLEANIQNGLIPSNMNYSDIFDRYTYSAWIMDEDLNVHYASQSQETIPEQLFKEAIQGPVVYGDYELRSFKISGGYMFWLANVSQVHNLIEKLQDVETQLNENNDILRAELKLAQENIQITEQTELYTKLEKHVYKQLKKISECIKDIKKNPNTVQENLSSICVLGAYVKRDCNLILLSIDNELYEVEELKLCLEESLRAFVQKDIFVSRNYNISGVMKLSNMIIAYQLFENVIEETFENMHACMLDVNIEKEKLIMTIQVDVPVFLSHIDMSLCHKINGHVLCTRNGDDTCIKITLPLGGNYVYEI